MLIFTPPYLCLTFIFDFFREFQIGCNKVVLFQVKTEDNPELIKELARIEGLPVEVYIDMKLSMARRLMTAFVPFPVFM